MKLILFFLFLSQQVLANDISLLFRTDISHGFNIPYDSNLYDSTPVSSPRGDVAIAIPYTQGQFKPSVWHKPHFQKQGKIIWSGQEGEKISNLGITNTGDVCFAHYDKDFFLKALVYLNDEGSVLDILQLPKSWAFASAVPKNKNFHCSFSVMQADGNRQIITADFLKQNISSVYSPLPGVSYLFTPTSNFKGDIFFKIRYGQKGQVGDQQPDQLLMFNGNKTVVLLSDKDENKDSLLYEFSHLLSGNSLNDSCFYANDYQQLFTLNQNKFLTEVPMPEGQVELFTPDINNTQHISVRHIHNKKHHISAWSMDNKSWKNLVSEEQDIPGDTGPLTISAIEGPPFAGGLTSSDEFLFVQVRFKDRHGINAGSGLIRIKY